MTENTQNNTGFFKRNLLKFVIIIIIILSLILPSIINFPRNEIPPLPSPILDEINSPPKFTSSLAGESNFTRTNAPFVLNNYPNFTWKNPGQFDSGREYQNAHGIMGYDSSEPAPGTGNQKYPNIYASLNGLNESNIRICYLDANYEWISVPYQIDNKGWVNIWSVADLNKWGGLDTGLLGSYGPGSEHTEADPTVGLGWIGGDMVTSMSLNLAGDYAGADYGGQSNDLLWDWYRIPTWTYITPGSSEMLVIDPEYRDQLVYQYLDSSNAYHDGWMQGPATDASDTNYWDRQNSATDPEYHRIATNNARPAFVNTTTWTDPTAGPNSNMIFMGDTWFTTPGDYTTTATGQPMPQWVRDAYPYTQIDGAIDNDDEICFYVYPGRKAPNNLWWNSIQFPNRFELEIIDPIDGGRSWMYIYFNNETQLYGKSEFDTIPSDYCSWDSDTLTITTDLYQISLNDSTPSLLDDVRVFGASDGASILTQYNKMYSCAYIQDQLLNQYAGSIAFGREGIWYDPQPTATPKIRSELVCSLDNPSVLYLGISDDTGQITSYISPDGGDATVTGNRSAAQTPYGYYGACATRPQTGIDPPGDAPAYPEEGVGLSPSLQTWQGYGDRRAIIDGPVRVILYPQQYLLLGFYLYIYVSCDTFIDDFIDFIIPLNDGPSFYYRNMQVSSQLSFEVPQLTGFSIQLYYTYMMTGIFNPNIKMDFKIAAAQEWSGTTDSIDQNIPNFGWYSEFGWNKLGGLDPKNTSYGILGYSFPDGVRNDYYSPGGNPLYEGDPYYNPSVCPPDGTNQHFPDWLILTSETHGGIWMYMPRRELAEIRDNNGGAGAATQPKVYFRDDLDIYNTDIAEFGICLDGGSSPWIGDGAKTSPFHSMWVFDNFTPNATDIGHQLYLQYFFPLEVVTTISANHPLAQQFRFESITPEKLVYKTGDIIMIEVTGSPLSGIIELNFSEIETTDPNILMSNNGNGTWTSNYFIDNVDPGPIERKIHLTANVSNPLWLGSTYDLTITIDDLPPNPCAKLAELPNSTYESAIILDWSLNTGYDGESASIANPTGLNHYRLRRGTSPGGPYNETIADNIPISVLNYEDKLIEKGKTYYYILDTFDSAGNFNTSIEVSTNVVLPFQPAQPDALPPVINPTLNQIILNWSNQPGYTSGLNITGYRVFKSTTLTGAYNEIAGLLSNTTYKYIDLGPFNEGTSYYYKIMSHAAGINISSSPVKTKIDTISPVPAELALLPPVYNSSRPELILSWALELVPEYQTGGFPGHDLNGIDHWDVLKKTGNGSWNLLQSFPFTPVARNQRILDRSVSNGTNYSYSIKTFDAAGNSALCKVNKTSFLNFNFGLKILLDNRSYNNPNLPFNVINTSALEDVWYRTNAGAGWSSNQTLTFNGTHFINGSTLTWIDGFHHIQVFANDTTGYIYQCAQWITIDTQSPSGAQWLNLTSKYIQTGQVIWINGTVLDPDPSSGISLSHIYICDSNSSTVWSNNVGLPTQWAFFNLTPVQENLDGEFYQIKISLNDNAGNCFIIACNITVDATPPHGFQYSNTSSFQSARNGIIWINGSAVDYGTGVKCITIIGDNVTGGTTWSLNLGSNQSWSFSNTSFIQDTSPTSIYEVLIEIRDFVNNSYILQCIFILDSSPPEGTQNVESLSPQKGDLNSYIWVNGSCFDLGSGVKTVTIIGDNITGGTTWSTNIGTSSNWAFKNTSPIVDTPFGVIYEVLVNISDELSNFFILPCYLSVDTIPPNGSQAVATLPAFSQPFFHGGRIWINGTATDFGSGLLEVIIQNSNISGGSSWYNAGTLYNWAFYNTTIVPELNRGECYLIELRITDIAYNSYLLKCYITVDFSGPTLIQSSSTLEWQSGPSVWLNGTAYDNMGNVTSVAIISSNFTLPITWIPNSGTNQSWSFDLSNLSEGCWSIVLQAFDSNGYSRSYLAVIFLDLTPPTPPLLYYEEPYLPSFIFEGTLLYLFGAQDPNGSGVSDYEYRIDFGVWKPGDIFTLAGLADGLHDIEYRAVDRAGNIGDRRNASIFLLKGDSDYDNDSLTNDIEIHIYKTNPVSMDTDGDGLTDPDEIFIYGTAPTNPDTDSDGINDGDEISKGSNPLDSLDPRMGYVVIFIRIIFGVIIATVIVDYSRKRARNFHRHQQKMSELSEKSKTLFNTFNKIIPSISYLDHALRGEDGIKLPPRLQNLPPEKLLETFQVLLNQIPEGELKLNLSEILLDIEMQARSPETKQILPKLKLLNKLIDTGIDRELLNYIILLASLVKNANDLVQD